MQLGIPRKFQISDVQEVDISRTQIFRRYNFGSTSYWGTISSELIKSGWYLAGVWEETFCDEIEGTTEITSLRDGPML